VYLDEPRAFYDALGGGKANKNTMASFLAKMLNPFSRLKKNIKRSEGTKGNLVGEGLVHGGVYVVPPGGKPFYAHAEVELGDHPPTEELLNALPQLAPIELPPEPVTVEAVSVENDSSSSSNVINVNVEGNSNSNVSAIPGGILRAIPGLVPLLLRLQARLRSIFCL